MVVLQLLINLLKLQKLFKIHTNRPVSSFCMLYFGCQSPSLNWWYFTLGLNYVRGTTLKQTANSISKYISVLTSSQLKALRKLRLLIQNNSAIVRLRISGLKLYETLHVILTDVAASTYIQCTAAYSWIISVTENSRWPLSTNCEIHKQFPTLPYPTYAYPSRAYFNCAANVPV